MHCRSRRGGVRPPEYNTKPQITRIHADCNLRRGLRWKRRTTRFVFNKKAVVSVSPVSSVPKSYPANLRSKINRSSAESSQPFAEKYK